VRPRWIGVIVHGAVVGFLLVLFFLILANAEPHDPNFGLGMVGVPLMILGLPWTAHALWDPYFYDSLPDQLRLIIFLGPAVLNLVIHALVVNARRAIARETSAG
jgi:hypothetical protein